MLKDEPTSPIAAWKRAGALVAITLFAGCQPVSDEDRAIQGAASELAQLEEIFETSRSQAHIVRLLESRGYAMTQRADVERGLELSLLDESLGSKLFDSVYEGKRYSGESDSASYFVHTTLFFSGPVLVHAEARVTESGR